MILKKILRSNADELNAIQKTFVAVAADQKNKAEFSWSLEQIQDELRAADFYIAWDEALGVGAFICYRETDEACEINALGTAMSFRRQGLMQRLLQAFLDYCRATSKPVHLEVHAHNLGAQALYRHLGFKLIRTRPGYYKDGGDALVMSLG